jgi:hypothetical protein
MEDLEMSEKKTPRFIFKKERELGDIISDTFTFFSQNNKILFNIFFKFISPFILLLVVSSTLYQYKTGDLFSDISIIGTNPDYFFRSFIENIIVMLFFIVTTFLTTVITYLAIMHAIKSYINNGGEIIESDISSGIKKDFWKMAGFNILFYIVTVIGIMFCFLPGIYIGVVLAPGFALVIMKDISATDAFSKCFSLIKDNWWITFATFLIFVILLGIIGIIFQLPATIYAMIEGFVAAENFTTYNNDALGSVYKDWIYLLFSAIAVIGQYFMNIFSVIMVALVYFNLSEKQEFTGTYEQIENIGN